MSKRNKIALVALLVVVLLVVSFIGGCTFMSRLTSGRTTATGTEIIQQAWDTVHEYYVENKKLDDTRLSQAAIKAIVDTIDDPYSVYMTPEEYALDASSLTGSFEGIGAHVLSQDGQFIVTPISGSPAEKAGIRAGDVVLAVNGQSTEGMSVVSIVNLIRGPKGTSVSLLVQHEGETESVTIDVVRDEIKIPSVDFKMIDDIAYVQLTDFTSRSNEELTPVLQELISDGAKGIVFDLRNNGGGYLDVCVQIASHFITEGTIVSAVDNKGHQEAYDVKPQSVTTDLPMVVLVNNYSASASEVFSGALQDYRRATIAGTKTFGKGSVNYLLQLDDGSAIYLTIGRWFTPDGRAIEGQGVTPDVTLTEEGDDAIQWAVDYLHENKWTDQWK